jgi:tetratricopeptide (TPR) repeat protein
MWRGLLTGCLLLLASTVAADYQAGLNAFSVGDYETAMQEWQAVVEGPPDAVVPTIYAETHFAIATLYWRGLGVEQDYAAARDWLLKAAELGHANAQAKLGFMYTDGLGVRQDYPTALSWFEQAAAGGSVDGLYNLGIFYLYGWGVEADRTMAKQYLAAASALGDTASEDALQQLLAEERAAEARREAERAARLQRREPPLIVLEDVPGEDVAVSETKTEEDSNREIIQQDIADNSKVSEVEDASSPVRDEAWILAQDPENFTIQVMALDSAERLLELIEGHEALAPFGIYRLENDGRPLFVLVQGVFEDVEAARAARDAFPRRLQRPSRVWIRRFEKVQELIRAERGE